MRKINLLVFVGFFLLWNVSGCSPQRLFYQPNRVLYTDPDKTGLNPELVFYPSANGKKLSALYFKTSHPPKGTIVYFHGNFGNVSNHFPQAMFLLKYGYDVLAFDYQGYGVSEGSPSPKRLMEDGLSSVRYAQDHLRPGATGVGVLGQSLGGATAIGVAAREPLVKAAVIEAAFTGHGAMARYVLGKHVITWLLYPIVPLFLNRSCNAIQHVDQISPRPVFFIHGDADTIVPVSMTQKLYEKAKEPKEVWIVKGAGHLEPRLQAKGEYEKRISDFFDASFLKGSKPG